MIELDQQQCYDLIARFVKEKTGREIRPYIDSANPMLELQLMHHMAHRAYDYFLTKNK